VDECKPLGGGGDGDGGQSAEAIAAAIATEGATVGWKQSATGDVDAAPATAVMGRACERGTLGTL
jgi:hypothetical protein